MKRIAFEFSDQKATRLINILDEKMDDYTTVTIKHPLHGHDMDVLIPNKLVGDIGILDKDIEYVERLTVDVVLIGNKISQCKKLADEIAKDNGSEAFHQLRDKLNSALKMFDKFFDMEYHQ